jgi:hypothetical protein
MSTKKKCQERMWIKTLKIFHSVLVIMFSMLVMSIAELFIFTSNRQRYWFHVTSYQLLSWPAFINLFLVKHSQSIFDSNLIVKDTIIELPVKNNFQIYLYIYLLSCPSKKMTSLAKFTRWKWTMIHKEEQKSFIDKRSMSCIDFLTTLFSCNRTKILLFLL